MTTFIGIINLLAVFIAFYNAVKPNISEVDGRVGWSLAMLGFLGNAITVFLM